MEIKKLKPNPSTNKKNQKNENIDLDTGYKYKVIWISLIAIIGSAIFFQTFNYNFSGDDGLYSFSNKATQKGLKDVVDIFRFGSLNFIAHNPTNTGTYRPVTLLTFSVEKQLFGEFRPSTGHIINIILYFLTLLLIGLFLASIFKIKKIPLYITLLVLLIYAVHPTHVEVVASIKSRDSLLCALFSYLAIYIWLYNYQKPNILKTTFIAILFLAGLLSKEEGLPLIMIVFLVSYVFLNLNTFNSLKQTLPFLFAAFFYLLIRTIILDPSPEGYNSIVNNIIFGTSGKTRLATNLYIYLYYIKLLFFPFSLSWDYSYNQIPIKTMANGWVLLSLCFFSALIIIALKGLRKREILSFGILFYLTTFSIFSNFTENITIGSTIGERFMFIPSLGFSIVLVYGLYIVLSKLAIKKKLLYIVSLIFPIILIFSTLSYSRTNVWRDNLALGRSGIKSAPKSWRTHVIYADELRIQANKMIYDTLGNYSLNDTAKGIFKEAILNYESGYLIIADKVKQFPYLQGLGECYLQIGDTVSAKKIYLKAAENPKLFLPLYKLGMISFDEKQYSNSIKFWQRSLAAESPDSFSTYKNIGASWLMLKEYEKSIEAYQKALKFKTSPDILSNMAFLYAAAGDYENANKFRPKDGNISNEEMSFHNYMASGRAAYETGNFGKAIDFFKKCDPGFTKFGGHSKFPDFLNTFARCYLMLNDISHSKATFKRVIQVDPRNYFALMNLGIISSRYEKNYNEAEGYFSSCLQSNSPDYLLTYENLGTTYWQLNQIDRAIENYENALKFGTSTTIVNYLIELWKYKGNSEKVTYYQLLKSKTP